MENQDFYLKISGALLSIIIAGTALIMSVGGKGLIAAALTAVAAILIKNAEKTSRKTGRTKKMKTALKLSKEYGEFIVISAGLISYPAGPTTTAAVIGFTALSNTVQKDFSDTGAFLGQEIRVGILILAFIGLTFNQYLLFYGLLALGLVAVSDSLYMLYRIFDTDY